MFGFIFIWLPSWLLICNWNMWEIRNINQIGFSWDVRFHKENSLFGTVYLTSVDKPSNLLSLTTWSASIRPWQWRVLGQISCTSNLCWLSFIIILVYDCVSRSEFGGCPLFETHVVHCLVNEFNENEVWFHFHSSLVLSWFTPCHVTLTRFEVNDDLVWYFEVFWIEWLLLTRTGLCLGTR